MTARLQPKVKKSASEPRPKHVLYLFYTAQVLGPECAGGGEAAGGEEGAGDWAGNCLNLYSGKLFTT